jgi:CRP-like cAMP-binding protein
VSLKFETNNFKKGDTIFLQNDQNNGLYIVQSGTVGIVKKIEKKISLVGILKEKDFLGGASLFSQNHRSASAVCVTDVEVIKISFDQVNSFIETKPEWIKDIFIDLVGKLNKSSDLLIENNIEKELSFSEYGIEPNWLKSQIKS